MARRPVPFTGEVASEHAATPRGAATATKIAASHHLSSTTPKEHTITTLASTVRQRRRALGLTQAEVAARADITHTAVANIELGTRAGWRKTRRALERALALPTGALDLPQNENEAVVS